MSGEIELNTLLSNMSPKLSTAEYVFASIDAEESARLEFKNVRGTFAEEEGLTVIIDKSYAASLQLSNSQTYRCITLQVHSSLQAVGLTAAVSKQLARHNISANVVAAYYHDHIFVPTKDASMALDLLKELTKL